MRIVIVTGMSGAGKSTALKILEDIGYFCVDNLPIPLLPKFMEMLILPRAEYTKVALGIDIRTSQKFSEMEEILKHLKEHEVNYEILYLDAGDATLIKRYKETRRSHPLAGDGRVDKGIAEEREKLEFLKRQADYIIDTSQMLTRELKTEIQKIFVENKNYRNLYVTILSFGFKYGIPSDADLVFDVRFLPNPYYIDELRPLSGNDAPVRDYVMKCPAAQEFLNKLTDMITFLIPNYVAEGKNQLVIAVGCTGGKHRSVTLANALYHAMEQDESYGLKIEHRDIEKDARLKGK
nr:RNase adapter RapZ [uncultured Sellimonas sp.]